MNFFVRALLVESYVSSAVCFEEKGTWRSVYTENFIKSNFHPIAYLHNKILISGPFEKVGKTK